MSSLAVVQSPERPLLRLSVPRRGHVLSTVTEVYGGPIRAAVQLLVAGLKKRKSALPLEFGYTPDASEKFVVRRSTAEMVAWHLCAQWVIGIALGTLSEADTLIDAVQWFDSKNPLAVVADSLSRPLQIEVLWQLRSIADLIAIAELLPYIFDPHGPGSRLSVMRDPSTHVARTRRRSHGVFYTPADVAEHMAELALANFGPTAKPIRVFDPACGTGVFLRAAFSTLRARGVGPDAVGLAQQSLYGIDIDPWAVDAAAYVLLHDTLAASEDERRNPRAVWQLLRRNLAVCDALTIDPATGAKKSKIANGPRQTGRRSITEIFPAMKEGPNVIIGNPPYAPLSERSDLLELGKVFTTLQRVSATADMHPLFLEQMIRLAAPAAAGSLVLPLSIAFSGGQQYQAARELIEGTTGTWRFSFFDREPHALFGEDVKTRNTIIYWMREASDCNSRKMTGPLLKWRGHDRARMLRSIRHTEIHSSIATGIPKLSSGFQAEALDLLIGKRSSLAPLASSFYGSSLEQTFIADKTALFVGGTAYNFLNVFFRPPDHLQPHTGIMSTNTVHGLKCARIEDAFVAYALLSSGITFWLWHVLGDGFHVSRSFIETLPLGPSLFTKVQLQNLVTMGRELWRDVQAYPVSSLNRGRVSLSFPASRLRDQQRRIDSLIALSVGLPETFSGELDKFINSVVSALPSGESDAIVQKGVLLG
jgi:hypothetical protein